MADDIEQALKNKIATLEARIKRVEAIALPMKDDLHRAKSALSAYTGTPVVVAPKGAQASLDAVAHFARKTTDPSYLKMTMKQLVVAALREHFPNGATSNQLLSHFLTTWGRNDIMRSSLSPQLSRLKANEGLIELHGKVWTLTSKGRGELEFGPIDVHNENGEPVGSPDAPDATTSGM